MILQETREVPGAWLLQGGIHLRTTLATLKTREELGGPPSFKIRGLVGFAVHSSLIAGSANADASRKPAGWLGPSAELECKPANRHALRGGSTQLIFNLHHYFIFLLSSLIHPFLLIVKSRGDISSTLVH